MTSLPKDPQKDFDFLVDFLNRTPYTTPDGKILTGEQGAKEFLELFFPEEFDLLKMAENE